MDTPPFFLHGLDHVQMAIPAGHVAAAREFYGNVLGLVERPVPDNLKHLGSLWFEQGDLKVHIGIDPNFHPAKKAHPAFLVQGLEQLENRLKAAGIGIMRADPVQGIRRFHIFDPFGNRIELVEPRAS